MNLQPHSETITVQKEFLYSTEMLSFKTGGITLDAASFPDGEFVKAGTVVSIGATGNATGFARPYVVADGTTVTDAGELYVVAHDVKVTRPVNPIVGAVQEGYLHRDKITTTADKATIEAASNYRFKLRG
jgi:hypothetical protein